MATAPDYQRLVKPALRRNESRQNILNLLEFPREHKQPSACMDKSRTVSNECFTVPLQGDLWHGIVPFPQRIGSESNAVGGISNGLPEHCSTTCRSSHPLNSPLLSAFRTVFGIEFHRNRSLTGKTCALELTLEHCLSNSNK